MRVLGTACGLGISGSGWVAAPGVVVTAAHVVAGERDTTVVDRSPSERLPRQAVAFDPRNDVAVLRVPGSARGRCAMVEPRAAIAVGIVGYPLNGPLDVEPGRIGKTAHVLTDDAYGKGPVDADDHEPVRGRSGTGTPAARRSTARAACRRGLRDEDRRAGRVRGPGRRSSARCSRRRRGRSTTGALRAD